MKFKIHRGTQEIGGSCVEVWTDTTRIVVDIGMPLVAKDGGEFNFNQHQNASVDDLIKQQVLPKIDGLYPNSEKKVDGILISHYHQDHHGFLQFADSSIPVHTGAATKTILDFSEWFFKADRLPNRLQTFENNQQTTIGDISFTPYIMDHSAFDAYGFLIETNGKRLFYSGDFRAHGRKEKTFYWFLKNAPKNVDFLLMEGTTIGRKETNFPSEIELEKEFQQVFSTTVGINLITTSAQNVDRLTTIYKACLRCNKTMVVDVYTAMVMKEVAKHNPKLPHISNSFPSIKVMYPLGLSNMIANKLGDKYLFQFKNSRISRQEISEQQGDVVFLLRPSMRRDLEHIPNLKAGSYIYSMWSGYLQKPDVKKFKESLESRGFSFHQIHTSGHADVKTLKQMVGAVEPKNLVPIHTFDGDDYQTIFKETNVFRAKDGDEIEVI